MKKIHIAGLATLALSLFACCRLVLADDIDIYSGNNTPSTATPTVMFLLQSDPNWNKNSQKWPDNGGKQGTAETAAIVSALAGIKFNSSFNVGFALYGPGSDVGAYVRFGGRDISNASTSTTNAANLAALDDILNEVGSNLNGEQAHGNGNTDFVEGFYEMYLYFANLAAYAGGSSNQSYADWFHNSGSANNKTTVYENLTSGFALDSPGKNYTSPTQTATCGKTYLVFIANNANSNSGKALVGGGSQTYQGVTAPTLPAVNSLAPLYIDEWADFLRKHGTITYVLDAYNAQNNAQLSQILQNTAAVGGGRYYQVGSEAAIITALTEILTEIQSVNSSFAQVSLPVSSTNRSDSANQVFIGMFRPDPNALPRWYGNLKEYQLILDSAGNVLLGDSQGNQATKSSTGFITDCAVSFWTADDSAATPPSTGLAYWTDVSDNPSPTSTCTTAATPSNPALPSGLTAPDAFSDWPDGPIVEKGGAAEVLRRGNNPPTTTTTPTWTASTARTLLTTSTSGSTTSIASFTTGTSGLTSTLVNWIAGQDNDVSTVNPGPEKFNNATTNSRPSIHGDIIHSRPTPINFGTAGTFVYYGAGDGVYHAVNASNGKEQWGFIAPEFYSSFQRLYDNSPTIQTPNPALTASTITPTPTQKTYFMDGSTGVYSVFNSSNNITTAWIYPSMRRGGRMIYAFDVTTPTSNPVFKWKFGCPTIGSNTGCTSPDGSDATGIGQTWSTPHVAFLAGYSSGTKPVLVFGGGYDSCEDAQSATPTCTSPTGAEVYVLDANTGALLRKLTATGMRSIASDVQFLSRLNNGSQDYAYVADTGGAIWRIDFVDSSGNALSASNWVIHKIAYTSGGSRKFLFAPALLLSFNGNGVIVAIGSGDREHPLSSEYPYTTPVTNRFYTFVDDLSTSARAAVNLDDTTASDNLHMVNITNSTCTTAATCSANALTYSANPAGLQAGWFRNLVAGTGEQTVNGAVIIGGVVSFGTNYPTPASTTTCASNLGAAQIYALDLFEGFGEDTGTNTLYTSDPGGGLLATGVVTTTIVNGHTETVSIGAGVNCSGAFCSPKPPLTIPPKRSILYWKQSGDNR